MPGTVALFGVACPSATMCVAVGRNSNGGVGPHSSDGVVVPITNGIPGLAQVAPGTGELSGVACPSVTTCVAVGRDSFGANAVVSITNGIPGAPQLVGPVEGLGVACATVTFCVAVGQLPIISTASVVMPIINGVPGVQEDIGGVGLGSVACSSAAFCVAVGTTVTPTGAMVPIINGVPGPPVEVPGSTALGGVACPTSTTCEAVGGDQTGASHQYVEGVTVPIINGTPGVAQTVPGTGALSNVVCPGATTCEALGVDSSIQGPVVAPINNGTAGPPQAVPGGDSLFNLACPTATTCIAVGTNSSSQGVVATIAVGPSLGGYTPLTATRICDTRAVGTAVAANRCQGAGGTAGTLGQGFITVPVAGLNAVPPTAIGVVLNVTVTDTSAASYLTVWPTGAMQPTASNLNWTAGQTVANLVEVTLGASGSVNIYSNAGTADAVVDLEGYVDGSASGRFNPLTPARICDSRAVGAAVAANQCQGPGGAASPLAAGKRVITVAGMGGVPVGATAVVLNVTVTDATAASFLTVWPDGATQPVTSNLNWVAGQTVANRVIVPLGAGGKIDVFNAAGTTNVVVDVNGYYSPGAGGSGYLPATPIRICDTRPIGPSVAANGCNNTANGGGGPLRAGGELTIAIPPGVTASVFNVTVTNTTASSYLTVFHDTIPTSLSAPPSTSDLNWTAGQTVANLVVVGSGPAHSVTFYNNAGSTDVVVDLEATYSTAPAGESGS